MSIVNLNTSSASTSTIESKSGSGNGLMAFLVLAGVSVLAYFGYKEYKKRKEEENS